MTNIDIKYEAWKNKLLDLSKRNRLLNYRDNLRSVVKIIYPDCDTLYNEFVRKETALVFPYEDSYNNIYETGIKTNKNVGDLQKALKNLRNKTKIAYEEQGINMLYLSFGFLKWSETENSNIIFSSPLILVPVTLTITSITSPYVLSLHEDEIVINPTLAYKLSNDFGIVLPEFTENESIADFLEEIKEKSLLKNWSVTENVG